MPLVNLLFDLDGTLTDPKLGISRCIQHALSELGVDPPPADDLEWCIGPPLRHSFAKLLDSTDDGLLEQAVLFYRQRFAEVGLFENAVYHGIPEALAGLNAAGFRLFLATSKPRVYAERILAHFGLAVYFETAHGSELSGALTDKPSLVRHILATEGLRPDQTLIVGDRKYDIIGGKTNHIGTGAVTYGYGTLDELTASAPDVLVDAPDHLPLVMDSLRQRHR
ncbi:Haloacid dehalogenase domain protein hydrolase [Desulfobulbus propionicus DSM 2032]|uniref:Haloacid dehalogenase domain protein hydrolase n=1 Tax=Desulfobulbus propionicus (strain ATCC 33891 / DSM 2032 / VKM B-1956 / 1pr3) TaxID=577650 RepID=A0A7U3YNU8_DESPD|nr:HAD hydrolase-like protein [Desulfobulbus propionicus]ADW18814.1 Haloacid dehalogenase domain protein hydrolase [Desulfobulbus propionicus DSM 2032]